MKNILPTKKSWGQGTFSKGLSLIEVLMVLAIMGIMLGIGGLALMKNLPAYRLKGAARELVSNLQKARIEAVKRNMSCRVVFDVNNSRYAISIENGADGVWSTIADNTNLRVVALSQYRSGIGYGGGDAGFDATQSQGALPGDFVSYNSNIATFNSRGTGSSGYVYFENNQDQSYAVGSRTTGAIVLRRWNGSNWEDQ